MDILPGASKNREKGSVALRSGLSRLKTHPNHAFADPKFGSILQHRGAHALLVEKRSVRGIHVFQVDVGVANFQQAMTSGDLRVIQRDICPLAANDDSWLGERMALTLRRPRYDAKNDLLVCRKPDSRIGRRQIQ